MLKYVYITAGTASLSLGLMGIVTPGIPTTPFLLLTAYLYARSSPRLHKKLMESKVTGMYLNRMTGQLSWKARLIPIIIMWCMICFTTFVIFKEKPTMQWVMLGLGVLGTISQLVAFSRKRKTQDTNNNPREEELQKIEE